MAKVAFFHIVVIGLSLFASEINCAKILVMATVPTKSHFKLFKALIEGLSTTSHEVTVFSFMPLKPSQNIKVLQAKLPTHLADQSLLKDFILASLKSGPVAEMTNLLPFITESCEDLLQDDVLKTLLTSGKQYDVIIVDGFGDCSIAVASKLGRHIVKLYGRAWWPWEYTPVPRPPSYVPNFMDSFTPKMNFWQRFQNAVAIYGLQLVNYYKWRPEEKRILLQHFPREPDLLEEAEEKIVLSLTNGDPVMNSPRPTMPDVIDCGGWHCKEPKSLPKDLSDFVEKSGDNGFILFSLGTAMHSEFLPVEFRRSVLKAFSRLKQNVIWKYEGDLYDLPKNVKIFKWTPQQDLLGHPKIRLFITHSGLLSLQESIYHGVPVIGMPLFGDQPGNIARIKDLGLGEEISFFNVTTESLYQIITNVLYTKSYYDSMKKYSNIFKDRPEKPLESAIFWIEYVLRHNGASHLRSAAKDLSFVQYFLLDVIASVLLSAIILIYIFTYLLKLLKRTICCHKHTHKVDLRKKRL